MSQNCIFGAILNKKPELKKLSAKRSDQTAQKSSCVPRGKPKSTAVNIFTNFIGPERNPIKEKFNENLREKINENLNKSREIGLMFKKL